MISYGKQTINQSDIDSVIKILKSDWLTQGPAVENFENGLKNVFGSKYACAVSNGTAALHLVAKVLNWSSGDIILTTPNTFLATANCIEYVGAAVDFVDINDENFTIDVNMLEEKIISYKNRGKKIKAVIAVDYAGHPCDWKSLKKIADRYEFQLINDNCHALGASYNGDSRYAIKYANFVTQSFHPVKMITTGEGGAVITNDLESFKKLQVLRSHGITKDPKVIGNSHGPWYYEMHEIGYNYRITDIQCALGSNQIKRLKQFVLKRRKIAETYRDYFSNIINIKTPSQGPNIAHAFHLYPLQINFKNTKIDKKTLFKKLFNNKINLQVHYIPIHLQPYYKNKYGFSKGEFPNAEKFYEQEISLPIYPKLNRNDQTYIISIIKQLLDNDG